MEKNAVSRMDDSKKKGAFKAPFSYCRALLVNYEVVVLPVVLTKVTFLLVLVDDNTTV